MRELLRQMAGESYVELEPNCPARVTGKCYQSLRDFFLFAPIVYVASPPLAADRRTEEELAQLRDIQPDFRAAIAAADVEARVFLNDPFHLMIGEVAQNAYVRPGLRRCLIDHARIAKVFYEDQLSARNPKMRVERDEAAIASAGRLHDRKLASRFPSLAGHPMQYRWAGTMALIWSSVSIVEETERGLWLAAGCNGVGATNATANGIVAAERAISHVSDLGRAFTETPAQTIPPEPIARIGGKAALKRKELRAGDE